MRPTFLLLAFLSLPAVAQQFGVQQQIQNTSPQLVSLAGSDANLQALANGLSGGQTITLVSPGADGVLQIVTFTPPSALGADASRALEQARTLLISRGITQPSAQQIAASLMGGTLVTSAGPVQVQGVLTGTIPANAFQVRNEFTANPGATAFGGSATNVQALNGGLRTGRPITLTGTGSTGTAQSITFTAPGGPMSAQDASQALQLASQLLANQGILSPTVDQIRTALLGGPLTLSPGNIIAVQGVLQGRVRNTSDSTIIGTSNSPSIGTSNSSSSPIVTSGSGTTEQSITGSGAVGLRTSPTVNGPTISSGAGSTAPAPIVGTTPSPIVGSGTAPGSAPFLRSAPAAR